MCKITYLFHKNKAFYWIFRLFSLILPRKQEKEDNDDKQKDTDNTAHGGYHERYERTGAKR